MQIKWNKTSRQYILRRADSREEALSWDEWLEIPGSVPRVMSYAIPEGLMLDALRWEREGGRKAVLLDASLREREISHSAPKKAEMLRAEEALGDGDWRWLSERWPEADDAAKEALREAILHCFLGEPALREARAQAHRRRLNRADTAWRTLASRQRQRDEFGRGPGGRPTWRGEPELSAEEAERISYLRENFEAIALRCAEKDRCQEFLDMCWDLRRYGPGMKRGASDIRARLEFAHRRGLWRFQGGMLEEERWLAQERDMRKRAEALGIPLASSSACVVR